MAVNVRTPDEQEVLSHFTLAMRVPLPCTEADPRRRLAQIAQQTRRIKADGRFGVVERRLLDRVPRNTSPRVFAQLVAAGARPADNALVTSNMGTVVGPYTVAGRQVTSLIGMSPLLVGRQHLAITLFGLDEQVCAAFTASASVPGHTELAGHWLTALDELDAVDGRTPHRPMTSPATAATTPVLPVPRAPTSTWTAAAGAAVHVGE
ncbi:WS/DGAT domain-containing protein [Frankia sp. R82]|uniref:WS/DGAT domain-containing protein n=1 Tax=Frankia sp. R82 TaxID=2950553 RepID=UPI00204347E9|nr:WS/DGAT domain-containing protein [Frankia sp. R82]MCM3885265.1 WSD1 family O-acyltransferase [Frankia sp. R82]